MLTIDCTALFGGGHYIHNTLLLLAKVIYSLLLTTSPINILQGKSYISSSPSIKKETGKASGRQGKGGQACNHFCNKPKREPITLFFTSSQSCLVIVDWMDISVVQFLIAYQMNYCQTFLHCTCHLKEDLPGALEAVRDGGVMPPTPLPSDLGRWVNSIPRRWGRLCPQGFQTFLRPWSSWSSKSTNCTPIPIFYFFRLRQLLGSVIVVVI